MCCVSASYCLSLCLVHVCSICVLVSICKCTSVCVSCGYACIHAYAFVHLCKRLFASRIWTAVNMQAKVKVKVYAGSHQQETLHSPAPAITDPLKRPLPFQLLSFRINLLTLTQDLLLALAVLCLVLLLVLWQCCGQFQVVKYASDDTTRNSMCIILD